MKNEIKASFSDDESGNMNDSNLFGKKDEKKDEKSKTPVLDSFGRDLSKLAEEGKLDSIVGRDKEIERVSQILSRRKKNNPILIGEPGCVDGDTIITVRKVSTNGSHKIIIEGE